MGETGIESNKHLVAFAHEISTSRFTQWLLQKDLGRQFFPNGSKIQPLKNATATFTPSLASVSFRTSLSGDTARRSPSFSTLNCKPVGSETSHTARKKMTNVPGGTSGLCVLATWVGVQLEEPWGFLLCQALLLIPITDLNYNLT